MIGVDSTRIPPIKQRSALRTAQRHPACAQNKDALTRGNKKNRMVFGVAPEATGQARAREPASTGPSGHFPFGIFLDTMTFVPFVGIWYWLSSRGFLLAPLGTHKPMQHGRFLAHSSFQRIIT